MRKAKASHKASLMSNQRWLVCTHSIGITSRCIPTWRQHVFTGSEREVIQFFIDVDFKGDLWGWIDDEILEMGEEYVAEEIKKRYKDFGEFDFPHGYTEIPRGDNVSDLWNDHRIMWGMDEYVDKID
jgi:hypothetical protein